MEYKQIKFNEVDSTDLLNKYDYLCDEYLSMFPQGSERDHVLESLNNIREQI